MFMVRAAIFLLNCCTTWPPTWLVGLSSVFVFELRLAVFQNWISIFSCNKGFKSKIKELFFYNSNWQYHRSSTFPLKKQQVSLSDTPIFEFYSFVMISRPARKQVFQWECRYQDLELAQNGSTSSSSLSLNIFINKKYSDFSLETSGKVGYQPRSAALISKSESKLFYFIYFFLLSFFISRPWHLEEHQRRVPSWWADGHHGTFWGREEHAVGHTGRVHVSISLSFGRALGKC